nr:DnaJ domain-containing protein [Bacteroidia bacterium]
MKDYYKILGISSSADNKAIRKAWLKKAHEYHPDHNPDNALAEENFKEVQEAYRVLSDSSLRFNYDTGMVKGSPYDFTTSPEVNHYFYVVCDIQKVKCFEELSITFTYSGNGRIFRRPSFEGFHLTGSPFVDSRIVIHEGRQLKETSLTYIICPMKEGKLTIEPASIRIQGQIFKTPPMEIVSTANKCYFIDNQTANGKPLKYDMHYEFKEGEEPLRMSELKKNHTILIPRSKGAYIFHSIGTAMKWTCTLWGTVMFNYYFGWNLLAGALAGNILGGLNVQL